MLINLLTKEDKFYFIDLLNLVASEDGMSDKEIEIIKTFKLEMGEDAPKYHKSNLSLDKLMDYFSKKAPSVKNIVFMNLLASTLNDDFYSAEEHFLMEKIQTKFNISAKKRNDLMKIVYAERDLKEKAKRVVIE